MRDSDWLKINLHLIFLICVQTQILCNGAISPIWEILITRCSESHYSIQFNHAWLLNVLFSRVLFCIQTCMFSTILISDTAKSFICCGLSGLSNAAGAQPFFIFLCTNVWVLLWYVISGAGMLCGDKVFFFFWGGGGIACDQWLAPEKLCLLGVFRRHCMLYTIQFVKHEIFLLKANQCIALLNTGWKQNL